MVKKVKKKRKEKKARIKKIKKKIKIREIKKKIEEIEPETLEKETKQTEEAINKNQFQEFIQPSTKSFSPILEKASNMPKQESLEEDINSISTPTKEEDKKIEKYDTKKDYDITKDYEFIKPTFLDKNMLLTQPIQQNKDIRRDFQINPKFQESEKDWENLEKNYLVKTERTDKEFRNPFEDERERRQTRENLIGKYELK